MSWNEISLGADAGPHRARFATQDDGTYLHVYVKFGRPGQRPYMLTASMNLRQLEEAIQQEIDQRELPPGAVSGGRLGRKIRARLKKVAKKIGSNKLVKGIARVAKKVLDNPLVKGVLAATPGGAAFLAVRAAAKVAAKAVRGGKKAKNFIAEVAHKVKRGDPGALKMARLLKQGIKYSGVAKRLPMAASAGAYGERDYLASVLGACLAMSPHTSAAAGHYLMVAGDDGSSDDHEIEAVDMIAASGAFEGVRWAAERLGLHSMVNDPHAFTTRNALMLGHSVMTAPRR